jgi:Spy/CpxP family protein refolding chaperone
MDEFRKNRIIIRILAILLLISISALATILFKNNRNARKASIVSAGERCSVSGTFLKKELGLTDAQGSAIEDICGICRGSSQCMKMNLQNRKSELIEELSRENSDTALLNRIAADFGSTQKDVIKMTIRQYLEIKKICDPEQRKKLALLYSELFGFCKQKMDTGKKECNTRGEKDCCNDNSKK